MRAAVGKAEHRAHVGRAHRAGAHRDRLIEQRSPSRTEPSAARAISVSALGLRRRAFLVDDARKVSRQHGTSTRRRSKRWQRDSNRHRHLAHFGRREDELHVLGRLFERFSGAR